MEKPRDREPGSAGGDESEAHLRPRDAVLAGAAGGVLCGLWIAHLTLRLNPHIYDRPVDTLLLLLYGALGSSLVGMVLGAAAALGVKIALLAGGGRAFGKGMGAALVGGSLISLPLYALCLPDTGLAQGLLTDLALSPATVGVVALIVLAAGRGLVGLVRWVSKRIRLRSRSLVLGVFVFSTLALGLTAIGAGVFSPSTSTADPSFDEIALPEGSSAPAPPPVVLLMIDGADLDDVILPAIEAGDLPTFASLIREGTWGELATLEPTLSPVVWTTAITGQPPAEHGIHHFVYFRLPGIASPILHFPLHTGLNFQLFPRLERLPGMPGFRVPYTSDQRLRPALWEIVARRHAVGSFHWLISWPAEEVEGFFVSGGLGSVKAGGGSRSGEITARGYYPPRIRRNLRALPRQPADAGHLAELVGAEELPEDDPRLRAARALLRDRTVPFLSGLIEEFEPRFTAVGFSPVDAFNHYFGRYRGGEGPLAGSVDAAYRVTDARLGDLLAALPRELNLVVISDHGFDFEHDHHTWSPPGIFLAKGPAFEAGRRVEGLSIYDVAPLVLRLLDLPLAEDMPGTAGEGWRRALRPELRDVIVARIPTYGRRSPARGPAALNPDAEEIKKELRSLGYLR